MNKWNRAVVVDFEKARIFSRQPFELLDTIENPLAHERNTDLADDKQGVSRAKMGGPSSTHSLGNEKDPREDAAMDFSRHIASYLEALRTKNKLDSVLVVAEPKMKGRIKSQLSDPLLGITEWLDKDLGKLEAHELKTRLDL